VPKFVPVAGHDEQRVVDRDRQPSMIAKIVTLSSSFTNNVATRMSETPMPMPKSAARSGIPAAMSEPSVMISTTAAMPVPMSSAGGS